MATGVSSEILLDITPHVSLFSKLGRSNFSVPFALSEFIDNAFDARGDVSPLRVNIDLDLGRQTITITDNGAGMSEEELGMALKVGLSGKRKDTIGIYGFGLKAAAAFLAKRFVVETTTSTSPNGLRVVYDQDEFEAAGKWVLKATVIPKLPGLEQGTRITLTELNVDHKSLSIRKIEPELARVYHHLIQLNKLEIVVCGTLVTPLHYELLSKWDISLNINGKEVRGWVGARVPQKLGGNVEFEPGFELLRYGRVLKWGEWIGIKQHSAVRTLVGELELNDFEMNNNKTDFRRGTVDWKQLEEAMARFIKDNGIRQKIYQVSAIKSNKVTPGEKGPAGFPSSPPSQATILPTKPYQPASIPNQSKQPSPIVPSNKPNSPKKKVFLVHGLNLECRDQCKVLLESFDLDPIILQYQPNLGRTIIEKLESTAKQCEYAVILLTPDDMAYTPLKEEGPAHARPRARQNVVFEFGYFVGKLGRKKTSCIYQEGSNIELPTDMEGIVYFPFKEAVKEVKDYLKKELTEVGILAKPG